MAVQSSNPCWEEKELRPEFAEQIKLYFCKQRGVMVVNKYPLLHFTSSLCCDYRLKYGVLPLLCNDTKLCGIKLTMSCELTMQYIYDIWLNCTLEDYWILLNNITPITLTIIILKRVQINLRSEQFKQMFMLGYRTPVKHFQVK